MQSVISSDFFIGTKMDDKSAGTTSLCENGFVDYVLISICDIVTTTGTVALKVNSDVDTVIEVELE